MKNIVIIGHVMHAGSGLQSAINALKDNVEIVEIGSEKMKNKDLFEPEPFIFKEREFFTEPKYYDIKPSKFISKPKNNFSKKRK